MIALTRISGTTHEQDTEGVPQELADIVGDVSAFFAEHWSQQPVVLRAPSDVTKLISEREIWEEVDCGLLSRPYFTMFNEGVRPAIGDMTVKRTVVGQELSGFVNAERIHHDFADGATFKFNQAEHWHPRIRALVAGIQPHFDAGLEAFVFLSPPGKTAMQAHTDGSHVFVIQVAGVKDWVVGRLDETAHSGSALHEGQIRDDLRMELTLRPGDVLYMPHGCPHYATARDGNSIHVAITIEEPSSLDLANVYLAELMGSSAVRDLVDRPVTGTLMERVEAVRTVLTELLAGASSQEVLQAASTLRRLHRL